MRRGGVGGAGNESHWLVSRNRLNCMQNVEEDYEK